MERRNRAGSRPRGARPRARLSVEGLEVRALLTVAISDKIGNVLTAVLDDYLTQTGQSQQGSAGLSAGGIARSSSYHPSAGVPNAPGLEVSGDTIVVDAVATGDVDTLRSEMSALGAKVTGQYDQVVGAFVPIAALPALAALPDLKLAEPSYKPVLATATPTGNPGPPGSTGTVDDQAVQAMRVDEARARYDVNGAGVTVGVISDSFDSTGQYEGDVASGDLPAGVDILSDLPPGDGTDEGEAMAQAIYKLAPGVKLAFATAYYDITAFADAIIDLAKPVSQGGAGAKVIVDDVGYENEPIFQDGLVSQAVEQVVHQYGVTYFSAAGNAGRLGYESPFQSTTESTSPATGLTAGTYHNFATDGSTDIFQPIELLEGSTLDLTFQWDQPFASQSLGSPGTAGADNDLAIYLLDGNKNVVASSTTDTVGGDPFQNIVYDVEGDITQATYDNFYLAIQFVSGPAPGDMKYIMLGAGGGTAFIDNYATDSGTTFGHAEAADAAGVGAVEYDESDPYFVVPAGEEFYSSAGGTPVLFDTDGNRLTTPDLRDQPRFLSIDGSDNTFLGGEDIDNNNLPNFSGTSDAAPHAAAVAALMLQLNPSLTYNQVFSILENTAVPASALGSTTTGTGGTPTGTTTGIFGLGSKGMGGGLYRPGSALTLTPPTRAAGASGTYSFDTGYGLIQADKALAAVDPITLTGQVYQDVGQNGHYVAGDPVAAGATVYLDVNGSGSDKSGTTTVGTTTALDIPADNNPANGPTRVASPLTVSGVPGVITHITVTLDVSEVEDSSLGLTLVSPTGIRIPLIENDGAGLSDFPDVTLDDSASDSVTDPGISDYTGGTFVPVVELTGLTGEGPNGTWQLEARDYGNSNGADGTLNSWSVHISYADPTATTDSNGDFTFTSPYLDSTGSAIATLAPAAYFGAYNVLAVNEPGYTVAQTLTQPPLGNPSGTTLTSSATGPTTYGQPVTFTATVNSGTSTPATGAVAFYLNDYPGGTNTLLGRGTLSNGVAKLTTSALPAGNDTVTAVYAGNGGVPGSVSSPVSQTVNQASATIALADSASGAVVYGTSITFTATVTNTSGSPAVPTGTVRFMDGATLLGQAGLANGKAVFTTWRLGAGTSHSVTAVYSSNANFTPVTSTARSQEVDQATVSIALGVSPAGPVPYGTSVTLTATVKDTDSTAAPTGVVSFYNGATLLGRAGIGAGGVAAWTTTRLAAGSYSVTASFGTANFAANTSSAAGLTINQAVTTAMLTSSTGSTEYGQSVTFHALVSNTSTSLAPTGTVTFYLDYGTGTQKVLGTAPVLAGTATFTTRPNALPAGSDTVTAVYAGTGNFRGSTSNAVSQSVSPANTSAALSSNATGSVPYKTPVTFTAAVTDTDTGLFPSGMVQFWDGTTLLAAVALNGQGKATWTKALPRGGHSITAVYLGTSNFNGSTSGAIALTVV